MIGGVGNDRDGTANMILARPLWHITDERFEAGGTAR